MKTAPQAVIFDMDGLIFNTEELCQAAMTKAAQRLGHKLPAELYHRLIGLPKDSSQALLLSHFGGDFDIAALNLETEYLLAELIETSLCVKPGVIELLDLLDERDLPHAVATSSSRAAVWRNLTLHHLERRFDVIISREDYRHGKPNPEPFLLAASKLGIAPQQCLVLEDSFNGVRAAAAADMTTIMVPDLLEPTEEMRSLCLHVLRDLHEVREALGQSPAWDAHQPGAHRWR